MSVRECVRCKATTRSGAACKRRTCKYTTYCWQHTIIISKLVIKKSGIPGAGDGLYTIKNIKKGDRILEYTGEIIENKVDDDKFYSYGLTVNNIIIDAKSTQSQLGRYANDCQRRNKSQGHCKSNNAQFEYDEEDRAYLVATKRIRAGGEVFTAYGNEYWEK